mgnify:CR=1 FL=1
MSTTPVAAFPADMYTRIRKARSALRYYSAQYIPFILDWRPQINFHRAKVIQSTGRPLEALVFFVSVSMKGCKIRPYASISPSNHTRTYTALA